MKINNIMVLALSAAAVSIMALCNGGTTEIGNARSDISGSIVDNDKAVDSAEVELVAEDYAPASARTDKVFATRTDCRGDYHFDAVPNGRYYLGAKGAGKRLLRGPIEIKDSCDLATDELKPVSKMTVTVPQGWIAKEVYVKGATQTWTVASGSAQLDSLPSGEVTVVAHVRSDPAYSGVDKQNTMELTVGITPAEVAVASFGNAPPQLLSAQTSLAYVASSADTVSFNVQASDPEGLAVSYSIESGLKGLAVGSTSGTVTWQTAGRPAGDYFATVKIADAGGAYRTVQLKMTVAAATYSIEYSPRVDTLVLDKAGQTGRTYLFTTIGPFIDDVITAYRFEWGDGDTSAWQESHEAAHVWKSAGRYAVRFQVQVKEDGSFFPWSTHQWIQINNSNDIIPPVITLLGGDTVRIPRGDNKILADYIGLWTAIDAISDKAALNKFVNNNVDIYSIGGPYTLEYWAVDEAGNAAMAVRYVYVAAAETNDTILPVIDLAYPDSTIRIIIGSKWIEPGYTASDLIDGDITLKVVVDSTDLIANIGKVGTYTVSYVVTNSLNLTATKYRTVQIVDQSSDSTMLIIKLHEGDTIFCIDSIDVGLAISLLAEKLEYSVSLIRNDSLWLRPSDALVSINRDTISTRQGEIRYFAADGAGRTATKTLTVITCVNAATFNPKIVLNGAVNMTRSQSVGAWVEPGYSATDPVDGNLTDSVNVDTVGLAAKLRTPGIHYLMYWVTNSARSTVVAMRRFYVYEPVSSDSLTITLKGDSPDTVYMWSYPYDTAYIDPGATAIDPVLGEITSRMTVSGVVDVNKPGIYTRVYSVEGSDSMDMEAWRTVVVRIPPDDTSGMRAKYGVPMDGRLPPIRGTYELQQVEGATVDIGEVSALGMVWDSAADSLAYLQLYEVTGADTTVNVNIGNSLHSFDTRDPAMLIRQSGFPDLDGPYLVKADDTMMYWVAFSGRVVLVWRRVSGM